MPGPRRLKRRIRRLAILVLGMAAQDLGTDQGTMIVKEGVYVESLMIGLDRAR